MTQQDSADVLHGVAAIANFLGMKPRRVHHLIGSAGLRVFKLGGRICARRSSLEAWLSEQEQKYAADSQGDGQ